MFRNEEDFASDFSILYGFIVVNTAGFYDFYGDFLRCLMISVLNVSVNVIDFGLQ